jgi:sporulation protein YlmC with PRC-barrel domain
MRNLLLATTAIVTLATPAFADNQMTKGKMETDAGISMDHKMGVTLKTGYSATDNDHLASRIMGMPVYTSASQDAERIGDINNLVVGAEGDVVAAVIGVGGFLGIGEKSVAVGYNDLEWQTNPNGDDVLVVATTREQLESAPEFKFETGARMMGDAKNSMGIKDSMGMMNKPAATGAEGSEDMSMADNYGTQPKEPGMMPGDKDRLEPVDMAQITAEELIGTRVLSAQEKDIGEVGDIVLDGTQNIDALIIDVGGFLGIGEKPVAISPDNLDFMADATGTKYVWVDFTKAELENQPVYDPGTFDPDKDVLMMSSS